MAHDPRVTTTEPDPADQPDPLPQTWKRPDDGKTLPERDVERPLQDAGEVPVDLETNPVHEEGPGSKPPER